MFKSLLWLLLLSLPVSIFPGWKIHIWNVATASRCKLLNPIQQKRSCPIDQIPSEQTGWELAVSRACKDMKISWLSLSCQCQQSFTQSFLQWVGNSEAKKETQKHSVLNNHCSSWRHNLRANVWKAGHSSKICKHRTSCGMKRPWVITPTDLKSRMGKACFYVTGLRKSWFVHLIRMSEWLPRQPTTQFPH